jgi:DNA-binding transcriptional ArsR family regulator
MTPAFKTQDAIQQPISAAATMLKALANEHRLMMLCALAQRPMAVSDINRRVPIAQSALSQHLARLRTAGVVVAQRRGTQPHSALASARARRLVAAVCAEYRINAPGHEPQPEWTHQAERAADTAVPVLR